MTPLNAALALTALADVDVELTVNGLARDLDLELLSDVGFIECAAAVGASVRQRRLVDLGDLLGGRRWAVGLGAVVLARLATGSFGVRLGLALGDGPCLRLSARRAASSCRRSRWFSAWR